MCARGPKRHGGTIIPSCRSLPRPGLPHGEYSDKRMLMERPTIQTQRLLLRWPMPTDRTAIAAIVGDWQVARSLSRVPHPYSEADADFFLEEIVPKEWVWAIEHEESAQFIGVVGLTPEPGSKIAELGYWLARPFWGQGIATEAAKAVIDYGFQTLALPFILSGYFEQNPSSGRVLKKLGFVETGKSMRPCMAVGHDVPSIEMRLDQG